MKDSDLVKVLRSRDGLCDSEIAEKLELARERVLVDGDDPQDVLEEEFGLEPDYIFDLIG